MRIRSIGHELPPDSLEDGAYWVVWGHTEGGFTVEGGRVTRICDILRRDFYKWLSLAVRIGDV